MSVKVVTADSPLDGFDLWPNCRQFPNAWRRFSTTRSHGKNLPTINLRSTSSRDSSRSRSVKETRSSSRSRWKMIPSPTAALDSTTTRRTTSSTSQFTRSTLMTVPLTVTLPATRVAAEQVLSLDPASRHCAAGGIGQLCRHHHQSGAEGRYVRHGRGRRAERVGRHRPAGVCRRGQVGRHSAHIHLEPVRRCDGFWIHRDRIHRRYDWQCEGTLTLVGDPVLPQVDPQSHGVVLSLSPMQATAGQGTSAEFVARITNTGSEVDTFMLSTLQLPGDFEVKFQTNAVVVPLVQATSATSCSPSRRPSAPSRMTTSST